MMKANPFRNGFGLITFVKNTLTRLRHGNLYGQSHIFGKRIAIKKRLTRLAYIAVTFGKTQRTLESSAKVTTSIPEPSPK